LHNLSQPVCPLHLASATSETVSSAKLATGRIHKAVCGRFPESCWHGDPLVMNTYLKITILVLATVCLALAALVFRSQKALANMHPLIVRINDVGRAEAIDYRNFQYHSPGSREQVLLDPLG
jgi:hypothetical protein